MTFHDLPLGKIVLTFLPLQGKIEVTFLPLQGEIEGVAYLAKTKSHTESTENTDNFFSTTNCTNFTNYDDIAAQYRFCIIFAISRIFAIPFLRANDSLLRKTAENTDLRENFISRRKYRNFF